MVDIVTVSVAAVLLYVFYKWATLNDDFFIKRKIKHLKPNFLVGNTGGFFMRRYRPDDFFNYLYNYHPFEKIVGIFAFRKPVLLLRDPEMVRRLAVTDFDHFINRQQLIDENADQLFGNSLFMMHGEKWRDMRTTLSPAFTGSKMRQMFELIGDCAVNMCKHYETEALQNEDRSINEEMKALFGRCANDVIATSAFGISVNSFANQDNEFLVNGRRMLNFVTIASTLRLLLIKIVPWLARAFDVQLVDPKATRFFRGLVLDTMETRQRQNIYRPDMINIMMQLKQGRVAEDGDIVEHEEFAAVEESEVGKREVKREWSDTELIAQCFLFFVAGFETTSTILSFVSHELATNPEVQQRLFEEITEVSEHLQGKRLPYDEILKMKYLDMVVCEALRKWPPAMFTNRECVKEYEYDDGENRLTINKGTAVWIPIYSFQNDPNNFANPEHFNPERFNDENKKNIVPGTYIPFGLGPRNCIGSRFALMTLKVVIYNLVLKFKFEPNAKTQIPIKLMKIAPAIPIAEKGVHLQLKLRVAK